MAEEDGGGGAGLKTPGSRVTVRKRVVSDFIVANLKVFNMKI